VPRDLETICLRCLEKAPARRYASAKDLADDLRRWGNGDAIQARPAGLVERLLKWTRRRPAVAAVSLLGLVIVALALVSLGAIGQLDKVEQARQDAAGKAEAEHAARLQAEKESQAALMAQAEANAQRLFADDSLRRADRTLACNNVLRAHLAWQTG